MRLIGKLTSIILFVSLAAVSCETVDDDRIPPSPVRIPFSTVADWETYGLKGALDYSYFILEEGKPADYPFTSLTYTGFGGVLLCGDIHGNALAFDLACPVERDKRVRIIVDEENATARCLKCGSVFDVFANNGTPLSGEAARLGYGLQRYHVGEGYNGEYMLVSR